MLFRSPPEATILPAVGTGDPNDLILIGGTTDRTAGPTTIAAGAVLISGATPGSISLVLDGLTFRAAGTGESSARRDPQGPASGDPPGDGLDNILP